MGFLVMTGVFITIEGPDGAGKTTVTRQLVEALEQGINVPITPTREPGGIRISEKIRELILDPEHTEMDVRTEALLYAAARRQHLVEKIIPALKDDHLVICDRFVDSSIAYQGAGRDIGEASVKELNEFAIEGIYPDMTLYLDVEASEGLNRIAKGRPAHLRDRLDNESLVFHEKVRGAYLRLVEEETERMVLINTHNSIENIVKTCYDLIKEKYPGLFNE